MRGESEGGAMRGEAVDVLTFGMAMPGARDTKGRGNRKGLRALR